MTVAVVRPERFIRAPSARKSATVTDRRYRTEAKFFKTLPRSSYELTTPKNSQDGSVPRLHCASREAALVEVRELHGYTPWYCNLPDAGKGCEVAWKQLMDPKGFLAPFGPTTAEQRQPDFKISYAGHGCQWNGPSCRSRPRSP